MAENEIKSCPSGTDILVGTGKENGDKRNGDEVGRGREGIGDEEMLSRLGS